MANTTMTLSEVEDSFGFPVQFGVENDVTFNGLLTDVLTLENGMTLTFNIYTSAIHEDSLILNLFVDKNPWFSFRVVSPMRFSIG